MNRTGRLLSGMGLALALATTSACVVRTSGHVRVRGAVVVREAPPEPKYEEVQVRAGYVWVRGHWDWQNQWVWMPGHWERERAGKVWADGRWEQQNGQWVWVDGTWQVQGHGTVVVPDSPMPLDPRGLRSVGVS